MRFIHRGHSPMFMNHVSKRCLKTTRLIFHMGEVLELWRKTMVNNNSHVFNLSNCSVVFKM